MPEYAALKAHAYFIVIKLQLFHRDFICAMPQFKALFITASSRDCKHNY